MTEPTSVYQLLAEAGCELDHHESDLYVKDSKEAQKILLATELKMERFRSQVDGELWWEVPFMYEPWWQKMEVK